jgi:hypothetical protein
MVASVGAALRLRRCGAPASSHLGGRVRYYVVQRSELAAMSRGSSTVTWRHYGQRVKLSLGSPTRLHKPFIEALGRDRR